MSKDPDFPLSTDPRNSHSLFEFSEHGESWRSSRSCPEVLGRSVCVGNLQSKALWGNFWDNFLELCFGTSRTRCATEHANAKLARPRTNPSGNSVVTVLLHENLVMGKALSSEKYSLQCFPRQWACAYFLLLAGYGHPRKSHENSPIMPLISFLVVHENSTKNPRKRAKREKMLWAQ